VARSDATARALLSEFDIGTAPVDLLRLTEKLGALVVHQDMPADVSGMLLRRDGEQVIGVNGQHPPARRRFSMAHALGHLRLHRRRPLILCIDTRGALRGAVSSMASDREEAEANRFAAALLAPETQVRRAAAEAQFSTASQLMTLMAARFEVSEAVMTYRLISLGVVADPTM
jgi:Zn-dependent peptidase ImmA (M78 family)